MIYNVASPSLPTCISQVLDHLNLVAPIVPKFGIKPDELVLALHHDVRLLKSVWKTLNPRNRRLVLLQPVARKIQLHARERRTRTWFRLTPPFWRAQRRFRMHRRSSALVSGKSALDMNVQFSSVWHRLLRCFDRRKIDGTMTTFFSFCVMVELMEVSS